MIKFEHSVFALPFALTGALLAFRESGFRSRAGWGLDIVLWIVVAMVGARSAAMAFNRLVDAEIDARNPRTKIRHIPAGLLSRGFCWGFTIAASALFFCSRVGTEPALLPPGAARAGGRLRYSFTKRFTHFRIWCWDSRWASRRPPRGSRCAARSIRASSGSPPRSRSGPPASTSSTPARITSSTATGALQRAALVGIGKALMIARGAARADDRFAADAGL
jgi:hypothetical protein